MRDDDGPVTPLALLRRWLDRQLPGEAAAWFGQRADAVGAAGAADRDLYLAIGLVPRRVGKEDLRLSEADLADAREARRGWDPRGWSVDQAARVALLLAGFEGDRDEAAFARRFEQLCRTADVGELVGFYRGLPLYPGQGRYLQRAAEGARSNMKAVFEAVAHRNPYPAERFPENAWNHMVLKALFIGSALHPIQGLDERANPTLMRMLSDYAHERWAAGRPVSPELWRCVGPYADDRARGDLGRVLATGGPGEREAAALALAACPDPRARELLASAPPELAGAIERGELSWESLANTTTGADAPRDRGPGSATGEAEP